MFAAFVSILVLSVLSFVLFAYDKQCAQNDRWRISEFTLLFSAASGGAMGALAAMYLFHHKTLKSRFIYGVPFIITTQTILLIIIANIFL